MRKIICFLAVMLFISPYEVSSQELLHTQDINFSRRGNPFVYPFVNPNNFESYVLFYDQNFVKLNQYSLGFLLKDTITLNSADFRISGNVIGARVQNPNQMRYFWTNNNASRILSATIDLDHRVVFPFNPVEFQAHELLVQAFNHNNSFYVLTTSKKDLWLRLYVFQEGEKPSITTFNMRDYRFINEHGRKMNIMEVLRRDSSLEFPFAIERIDEDFPTSLVQAAKKRKLYVDRNQLLISFDFNPNYTEWLVVNLDDMSTEIIETYYIKVEEANDNRLHNSFYHQGKVYQIQRTTDGGHIRVLDLNKGTILAQFDMSSDEIKHRNGPLMFLPDNNKAVREFKREKFFYRKARNSHWGLTVYPANDHLWVTVGAVKENIQTAQLIGEIFLNLAVVATGGLYTPYFTGLSPEMYQMSFFDLKLDALHRHRKGEMGPTAHTKIGSFLSNFPHADHVSVFRRGSYFVLGYYLPNEQKYYLRFFDDQ